MTPDNPRLKTKTLAFFFLITILLQSCVAYQNTPVSLQQAEQSKKQVKVNTVSNQTYHFKQIVSEGNQFYGLKKKKGEVVKIALQDNAYNKVYLHSKRKSTWTTIAAISVPVITFVILGSTVTFTAGNIY